MKKTATVADAVVVGSAVIDKIAEGVKNESVQDGIVGDVHKFVRELAGS